VHNRRIPASATDTTRDCDEEQQREHHAPVAPLRQPEEEHSGECNTARR
jgi:hypothetical protein